MYCTDKVPIGMMQKATLLIILYVIGQSNQSHLPHNFYKTNLLFQLKKIWPHQPIQNECMKNKSHQANLTPFQ